jgi:hypothetical protein
MKSNCCEDQFRQLFLFWDRLSVLRQFFMAWRMAFRGITYGYSQNGGVMLYFIKQWKLSFAKKVLAYEHVTAHQELTRIYQE